MCSRTQKLGAYIVARKIYLCHLFSISRGLDWPMPQLHNLYFYTVKDKYKDHYTVMKDNRMHLNIMHNL